MAHRQVEPGRRVRLRLAIHLADGTEALSSFEGEPLDFVVGDGTLAPGLEALLIGLETGSETQTLADGAAVYGAPDPGLIQTIPRQDLPPELAFAPGQVVSFTAPGGQETAGTILEATADAVRVDFNHPLSRQALRVRVLVLCVD